MSQSLPPPTSAPLLARVMAGVLTAVVLAASLLAGAVFFFVLLGLLLVFGLVLAVRIWWFRRRYRDVLAQAEASMAQQAQAWAAMQRGERPDAAGGRVIDGEYRREE